MVPCEKKIITKKKKMKRLREKKGNLKKKIIARKRKEGKTVCSRWRRREKQRASIQKRGERVVCDDEM